MDRLETRLFPAEVKASFLTVDRLSSDHKMQDWIYWHNNGYKIPINGGIKGET
jgi:hypothetical protein